MLFAKHRCKRKSSPHNLFPSRHTGGKKKFTGEPRGCNCARTVCQSAVPVSPPNKTTFFSSAWLPFIPPTPWESPSGSPLLPQLFSPLSGSQDAGWLRWYCTRIPLLLSFLFLFFFKTNGQKKFPAPHCTAEHDFRRVTMPLAQQQVSIMLLYIEEETSVVIGKCRTQVPFSFFSCEWCWNSVYGNNSRGGQGAYVLLKWHAALLVTSQSLPHL